MSHLSEPELRLGLNKVGQLDGVDYYEGFNEILALKAHEFIANQSYWSPGIPLDLFREALKNSWNFSAFEDQQLIGFGRLVTDRATFAYLSDVFVLPDYRARGIGKNLMEIIFQKREVQKLRRIILATQDAHPLYKKFGFTQLKEPDVIMEIYRPADKLYKE